MLIKEVFDTPAKYELIKHSNYYKGTFESKGNTYTVLMAETVPGSYQAYGFFKSKFGKLDPTEDAVKFDKATKLYPSYEIAFRIENASVYDISNTGNQYVVFTTVLHIIAEVIRNRNPLELQFDAKEPSRIKLYDAMINKLSSKFGFKDVSEESGTYVLINTNIIKDSK
jgi:hypothetical protein